MFCFIFFRLLYNRDFIIIIYFVIFFFSLQTNVVVKVHVQIAVTAPNQHHSPTASAGDGNNLHTLCDPPAADRSNIMGISLFLVCLCQLNNCNKSVWRGDRSGTCRSHTHTRTHKHELTHGHEPAYTG